ncbi:hypothetical protein GIB67_020014 [Kingdonia uniflora]|uniref:Cyclin N-terminal domain-containing protein n=1 Tax=Kingdonia uniflora TaxID=39325 RepID=A0A7J7NFH7_9MAGN|nr:hypothetical protein GIB67_020014 [Kingdonia uniflora]
MVKREFGICLEMMIIKIEEWGVGISGTGAGDGFGKEGKLGIMQLLAVACLSLAAKMEEIEVPLSVDLQVRDASSSSKLKLYREWSF